MVFSHPGSLDQMKGCGDADLLLMRFVALMCYVQWQPWWKPLWAPNFWTHLPSWMGKGSLSCSCVQEGVWHMSLLTLPDPWHGVVLWLCSATCSIRMWFTHVKSSMGLIFHRLSRGRLFLPWSLRGPRYLVLSASSVVVPKAELLNELGKFMGVLQNSFWICL